MPRVAAKAARSAGPTSRFASIAGSMTGRRPISAGSAESAGSAGRNRSPRRIRKGGIMGSGKGKGGSS